MRHRVLYFVQCLGEQPKWDAGLTGDGMEEAVLEYAPVLRGDAAGIMLPLVSGWWFMTCDDSIRTTTGVSAIYSASSCASLIKMLRICVESGVILWMLGDQDVVCGGFDIIICLLR